MNFKYILLSLTICIAGCGVKTTPKAPANTKLPTLIDKYSYKTKEIIQKVEKIENKKEKEVPKK